MSDIMKHMISMGYTHRPLNRANLRRFRNMRYRYTPQLQLGTVSIKDIEFDLTSRHEITPVLMALQHLYVNCHETLEKILNLIEKDISKKPNSKTGRIGFNYREILILVSLRLGCNFNYDQLADTATYHILVRKMLMLPDWNKKPYRRSTIRDNISRLSPETIDEIGDLIIAEGHALCEDPLEMVRGDSYVMKKNIHYPTDANLIWDAARKIVDISKSISDFFGFPGRRQHDYHKRSTKSLLRNIGRISKSRKKGKKNALRSAYTELIRKADFLCRKAIGTIESISSPTSGLPLKIQDQLSDLHYFIAGADYVCELAERRIIEDEKIPNGDKVFSHFEPSTELINRGKRPDPIEFGHRVLIIQDSAGFIIHGGVLKNGFTDEKVIVDVMEMLQRRYDGRIRTATFDKGFWTPDNLSRLAEFIDHPVLPKKGKLGETDKPGEHSDSFKKARKWHSGVESAIHALGVGNGANLCRDEGDTGYLRYLAMAVLGRNLHNLGGILIEKERERLKEADPLSVLMAA